MVEPTLHVAVDPDGVAPAAAAAWSCPEGGVVVVMARPGQRHLGWLLTDLARALGKVNTSADRAGGGGVVAPRGLAWLVTEGVIDLVVLHAEWLAARQAVQLCHLCDLSGTRLWLIADTGIGDGLAAVATGYGVEPEPLAVLEAHLGTVARSKHPAAPETRAISAFPPVSDEAVPSFLARASADLPPDDAARVRSVFLEGFDAMVELVELGGTITSEQVAGFAVARIRQSSDPSEAVTYIRGVQAAGLRAGWLVRIDARRLRATGSAAGGPVQLTPADWGRLGVYGRPRVLAIAVLACLGASVETITDLPAQAVALDGATVDLGSEQVAVPEPARRYLGAQHLFRLAGSDPRDGRYAIGTRSDGELGLRAAAKCLDLVSRTTGIMVRARWERWRSPSTGWRYEGGITVAALR